MIRAALLAAAAVWCASAQGAAMRVRVDVSPRSSVEDQAVHVRVRGLAAHERITVTLRSTDAQRVA